MGRRWLDGAIPRQGTAAPAEQKEPGAGRRAWGRRGKQLPSAASSRSAPSAPSPAGSSTSWLRDTSRWLSVLSRLTQSGTEGMWQQRISRRCGRGRGGAGVEGGKPPASSLLQPNAGRSSDHRKACWQAL